MVTKANHTVGGIAVTVYGDIAPPSPSPHGLGILFLLHGRFGRHDEERVTTFAEGFLSRSARPKEAKDLLVVTLDHRNHGARSVVPERNKGWKDSLGLPGMKDDHEGELDNPTHLVDMYSIQVGTARDVSFLIDFLPSVLFPKTERTISDWFVSGISLGGHSTWLAMAHDSRLTLGVPIIGSPSVTALMNKRYSTLPAALQAKLPKPIFTPSLARLIARDDPANVPVGSWQNKRILVLCGKDDVLVPWDAGGTRAFVEKLKGSGVPIEEVVEEGVGHTLSPAMRDLAISFVWQQGLKVDGTSSGAKI